jgi:rfaE bifunctional protein kinase chain/domain/rfaE bifunctional protein nucleotidyltransferase chain/domain
MSTGYQHKVVGLESLAAAVAAARAAGKTIVHCHGCFDIVHPGHIRYLEFARRQGDLLIVSVTGDTDVAKGELRPYIPQDLRAENLAALVFVDYVYVNAAPTAEELIAALKPEVYVKGHEYEHSKDPGFLAERSAVETYGGRIIFSSGEVVFSSTDLIGRISKNGEGQRHRMQRVCREHDITLFAVEQILDRFRDMHVLVVGDVVIDRYVLCDAIGAASEAPVLSLAQRDERCYVGGAAIVARHVAALGGHAFLLTGGGEDELSRTVREVLEAEGVQFNFVQARPSLVEKTRFLAEDAKVLKVDHARQIPLDSVTERRAATILEQQSKIADGVILCDFGYGLITGSLLARVLPALRQNVRMLAADVSGGRANLLNFRNVDLLCPTEREARAALNDYDSGVSAVAWNVLQQTQARHLLLTLEKRGLLAFERRSQERNTPEWSARLKSEQLPAFADHAVDHLGCGDALLAAATLALIGGGSLMQSAYIGNAAAAIEAGRLGNQPVAMEDLRDWLRERGELISPNPREKSTASIPLRGHADRSEASRPSGVRR